MAVKRKKLYASKLEKAIEELDNSVYVVEENGKAVKDPNSLKVVGNQLNTRLGKSSSFPTTSKSYVSTKKDDDENKWFKKGVFNDGYDFGDITKTILGTTGDVGVGVLKGITGMAEGIVDLGRYGISGVADLLGADKYAEDVKERARHNTTEFLLGGVEDWVDQYSVLGNKSDNITQALGYVGGIVGTGGLGSAAGLGTAGTTALTTGTTFTSSMGSGMGEAYDSGATDKEAATYGAIKGAGDAVTELIFGGLGKGINAVGLSKGLSSADDMLAKSLSSKISNQIAKNFVQFGVKAGAEGTEEVLAGINSAFAKKLTYMSEEDIGKLIKDEKLLDQFVAGAITSGIAQSGIVPGTKQGSLLEANKTGKDFITGDTKNKQITTEEFNQAVNEEIQKGNYNLTTEEVEEIRIELQEELQKEGVTIVDSQETIAPTQKDPQTRTLYTGSPNTNIQQFKVGGVDGSKQSGDRYGKGVYLTTNKDTAKGYAGESGKVYEINTDDLNIFNLNDTVTKEMKESLINELNSADKQYRNSILRNIKSEKTFTDFDSAEKFLDTQEAIWQEQDGYYDANKPKIKSVDYKTNQATIEYTDFNDLENSISNLTGNQLYDALKSISTDDFSSFITGNGYDGISFDEDANNQQYVIYRNEDKLNILNKDNPKSEEGQDIAPVKENTIDYSAVKEEEMLPYLEQENKGRMESITDKEAPIETERNYDYIPDTISMDKKSLKSLSKNIKTELGLNKAQTTELENVIQEFSTNETATREDLFNTIQERFSEQTIEHRNEELAEIKGDLRNRRIYVDDYLKSEFKDGFNKIRQQNFNKLKFTNDGMEVDSAYQELSELFPAYFPNDINNAQERLQRIIEVANEDIIDVENYVIPNYAIKDITDFVYDSINDYKFDEYVKAVEQARKSPIDDSMVPPIMEELSELTSEIKNMMKDTKKEIKSLKKEINGVKTGISEALEDITPVKEMKVNKSDQGMLDLGINKLKGVEGQPRNIDVEPIDTSKAKQLTIDGTEEDLVTKTKKELRKALLGTDAQKEYITNVLDNAKNRSMALMNNTDTIRNTELVFGRDAGKIINEVIFQKEIDNEADSIAWQNKERDEIKALGIKARSKESAAVQKYGEKQYINDVGELVAYGDKELASEFSDVETQEKIKRAAQVIRNKYDNYIDTANDVLTKLGFDPIPKRKDYMRHFQELNDVFSRYGIPFNAQNMAEHVLPTDINGLTEFWSPQKNYFANMQQRKGLKTTYDAITGVDGYIGGIANLIYHTEDIQRGRAFEELIRETYGENKGFENLENLPEELQQARAEKIQDNHLSNYAAWVHEWTNNVAGKKSKIDRSVESAFGRKAFSFLDNANKQVGSNMVGLNFSSSLTNLIAPVKAAAKTKKLAVLKGTADTIKNIFIKDDFISKNKFLTSRMGTDMLSKNAWQKIQDAGYVFMKGMDWYASNQIVRSKYYELRAKGMSEQQAHSEAGKFAARIMSDRTKGATPQIYNSKMLGLITKFQQEVNNDLYSMFYDTYQESKENAKGNALKTAAGMTFTLGQLFAYTHLFSKTFEAIAGYTPTLDVVEILKTAFGWGEDEDDEKTTSERLKKAADQLVDGLPYVNILTGGGRIPVASGLPNLVGVATGGKDQYGNELTLEDELKKLLYLIPPTGGNQIKKTTQGLSMFDDDLPTAGSYTDSGNLRYPVEDNLVNRIQAAFFGQYANENAGKYFDQGRSALKEKQIEEFVDLDLPIEEYWEYRDGLKELDKLEDKFEYINDLDVTDEQKNIMINNIVDRKEEVDMSNYDDFGSYDEFDFAIKNEEKYDWLTNNNISYEDYVASDESKEAYNWAYNNPENYLVSRAVTDDVVAYREYSSEIDDISADKDSDGDSISGSRKEKVFAYIDDLDIEYEQKLILKKKYYKSYDDYNYEIVEYLNSRDDISLEEEFTILRKLGFEVDDDGTVRWE